MASHHVLQFILHALHHTRPPPPSCCQVVLCATRCSFPTMANIMWALATLRGPSCTDEAMAAEEGTTAAGPSAIGSIGVARVASRGGAQPLLGACRWPGSDEVLDAIVEWGRWDPDLDHDLDPGTCSTKDLVSMIWGFSALLAQVRSDLDPGVAESGCRRAIVPLCNDNKQGFGPEHGKICKR